VDVPPPLNVRRRHPPAFLSLDRVREQPEQSVHAIRAILVPASTPGKRGARVTQFAVGPAPKPSRAPNLLVRARKQVVEHDARFLFSSSTSLRAERAVT
jgi:hypothetical protein